MLWAVIIIVAIFFVCLDTSAGKIVIGTGVVAIGLLLIYWITGFSFLITLAKTCAVMIVITIVAVVIIAIMNI